MLLYQRAGWSLLALEGLGWTRQTKVLAMWACSWKSSGVWAGCCTERLTRGQQAELGLAHGLKTWERWDFEREG